MSKTTEEQIEEIHAVVVKGAPANDKLVAAARAVVDARYYQGDDGWDRLKFAICGCSTITRSWPAATAGLRTPA